MKRLFPVVLVVLLGLAFVFPVTPSWAAGTLKVTMPNGGNKWQKGKSYPIRWNKGNAGKYVRIRLLKSGRHYRWVTKKTSNDGRYVWKIPTTVATGSNYKIRLQPFSKTGYDNSDRSFSIAPRDRDVRAIHMGGNWGSNVKNISRLPPGYFEFLKSINANWIGISVALHYDDSMDSTVERKYANVGIPTFTDEALLNAILAFRQNGFHVYVTLAFEALEAESAAYPVSRWQLGDPIVPIEDPGGHGRYIQPNFWPWAPEHPKHKRFVNKFWQTYTKQAVHFAKIAETAGAEMFSLGTETESLFRTRSGNRWPNDFQSHLITMVDSVRSVFSGLLTYDMYSEALTVKDYYGPGSDHLWTDLSLDVVGISAWFSLVKQIPADVLSVRVLEASWREIFADFLVPLKERNPERPILFLEFGCVDTIECPWLHKFGEFENRVFEDADGNGLDDGEETQANILEAFFRVNERYKGLVEGTFLWGHDISDDSEWANTWGKMRHFGVRQKLAEKVVWKHYGKASVTSPNGGEKWKAGKRYAIRWNKGNAGTYVKIQLLKKGRLYRTIAAITKNDGKHVWKVPSTLVDSAAYKIKISSTKNKKLTDSSDKYFTITK